MFAGIAAAVLSCARDYGQCGGDGWDGQHCCAGSEACEEKDEYYSQCLPKAEVTTAMAAQRPVVTSVNLASAGSWSAQLQRSAEALAALPWSRDVSVGLLEVSNPVEPSVQIVRNPGGGTSHCCKQHPIAAGARVAGTALQVQLEPRSASQIDAWSSRNGARVYFGSTPSRNGQPLAKRIADVEYVGWDLVGKRLEVSDSSTVSLEEELEPAEGREACLLSFLGLFHSADECFLLAPLESY